MLIEQELTYEVLKLSACLLNYAILPAEDYAHPRKITNFRPAHNKRVDIEPSAGQDSGDTRQNPRLILHETVENMPELKEGLGNKSTLYENEKNVFTS